MKPQEIKIGAIYRNAQGGRTTRKVLDIQHVNDGFMIVKYSQPNMRYGEYWLNLPAFARWAGDEVKP